jgi:hypothetical protein
LAANISKLTCLLHNADRVGNSNQHINHAVQLPNRIIMNSFSSTPFKTMFNYQSHPSHSLSHPLPVLCLLLSHLLGMISVMMITLKDHDQF